MEAILLFGLILNFFGVLFLAKGFQTQKASGIFMSGKPAISLKYENPLLRNLGWIFIILGYVLQIISVILKQP